MRTDHFIKHSSPSSIEKGLTYQYAANITKNYIWRDKEKAWMARNHLGQRKSMNSAQEPERAGYYGLRGRKNISSSRCNVCYNVHVNMSLFDDCGNKSHMLISTLTGLDKGDFAVAKGTHNQDVHRPLKKMAKSLLRFWFISGVRPHCKHSPPTSDYSKLLLCRLFLREEWMDSLLGLILWLSVKRVQKRPHLQVPGLPISSQKDVLS